MYELITYIVCNIDMIFSNSNVWIEWFQNSVFIITVVVVALIMHLNLLTC